MSYRELLGTNHRIAFFHAFDNFNAIFALKPDFDIDAAHELYRDLIGPRVAAHPETKTLFVIPDGAMQQISLAILVQGRTDGAMPRTGDSNRDLRFLGHEVALAHLPSPQFLIQQRAAEGRKGAGGTVGFGDPVLKGKGTATTRAIATTFDHLTGLARPDSDTTRKRVFSTCSPLRLTTFESGSATAATIPSNSMTVSFC